ncbi:MAG: hypothetical protein AB7K24_03140, partial [Gemmataceae bacterium]
HAPRFARVLAQDSYATDWLVLPYTLHYIVSRVAEASGITPKLGERWHQEAVLRTPLCFEKNVARILDLAQERGDPVLLMSFAYYIPTDYSRAAFKERRLDYDGHFHDVETWGTVDSVSAAIDAHNAVIRHLAATRKLLFVDQRRLMPEGKLYYNDPCHLTFAGCERYIQNLLDEVDWQAFGGKKLLLASDQ